jgi:hypothetical protein
MARRFPAPWTVETLDGGFKVVDANGQALAGFKIVDANGLQKSAAPHLRSTS